MGYNLRKARNGKSSSEIPKWPRLRAPSLKNEKLRQFEFFKNKICVGNVAKEQGFVVLQHFPYKSSNLSENSNCPINLLFNARSLNLGHFGIFDALFPILAFFTL